MAATTLIIPASSGPAPGAGDISSPAAGPRPFDCRTPLRSEHRERLASIGEMTARLVHQVRTPLASALLYASQLAADTPRQQDIVGKLTKRLQELGQMTDEVLGFARDVRAAQDAVSVAGLFEEVAANFSPGKERNGIRIDPTRAELIVAIDRHAVRGALINLVENALQACPPVPHIRLSAEDDDSHVRLSVSDNGRGIAPDVLPRLFEPFFTTRPDGTGLGLSIVQAVAQAHGGDVLAETGTHGATFTLSLPKAGGSS